MHVCKCAPSLVCLPSVAPDQVLAEGVCSSTQLPRAAAAIAASRDSTFLPLIAPGAIDQESTHACICSIGGSYVFTQRHASIIIIINNNNNNNNNNASDNKSNNNDDDDDDDDDDKNNGRKE